jgi:hypothetical protein
MKFEPQMSGVNEQTQDDEVRRERLLCTPSAPMEQI